MKNKGMVFWFFLAVVLLAALWFLLEYPGDKRDDKDRVQLDWDLAWDTVEGNRNELCAAFNAGAFEKIGPLYMENAVIRSAKGHLYAGRDEIMNYWRELNQGGVTKLEYELVSLLPVGEVHFTMGKIEYDYCAQEFGRYRFYSESGDESSQESIHSKNGLDYHQEDCPWRFGSEEHP